MSADSDLIAGIVGGTSAIKAWYDGRGGVNATGTNVSSWDDYRGPAGFGPSMAAHSNPQWDSVNGLVSCDGLASYLDTATDAAFTPTTGRSIIYIGSLPADGYALQISDSVATPNYWTSLNTQSATIGVAVNGGGLSAISSAVARSATKRLVMLSWSAYNRFGGAIPVGRDGVLVIGDSFGAFNQGFIQSTAGDFPAASWLMCLGHFASYYVPTSTRAILVVDHALTGAEWAAVQAWAAAVHSEQYTITNPNTRAVFFDGNSITRGTGAVPGTSDYPTVTMAQAGLSTNRDYINAGIGSQYGRDQLLALPSRLGPFLRSSHARKVYVCWELHNDITGLGLSAVQATDNIAAMCAYAKAQDPNVKTVVSTIMASGALDGTTTPIAQAANALIRDRSWRATHSVDYVADIEAIAGFGIGAQNASYFDVDTIHPNATGYNIIATHATNGFAAWIGAAFNTPTGPASPVDSLHHAPLATMRDGPWGIAAEQQRALGSTFVPDVPAVHGVGDLVRDIAIPLMTGPWGLVAEQMRALGSTVIPVVVDVALVVDDVAVAVSAENADLVQQNTLAIADASISVAADNVALVQQNTLAIGDVAIAVSTENVDLVQQNVLAVNNVAIAVTAENVALDVATPIVPADSAIAVTIDAPSLTQQNVLAIADALLAVTAEAPTLTEQNLLAIADALLAVALESPALVQQSLLAVADSIAALALESATLVPSAGTVPVNRVIAGQIRDVTPRFAMSDVTPAFIFEGVTAGDD